MAPLASSDSYYCYKGADLISLGRGVGRHSNSQVVKFVVQRLHRDTLLLDEGLLLLRDASLAVVVPVAMAFLSRANGHVELGNLVGVLARSGHLDRTSPVEVEVAESVGQLLQLNLLQLGLVDGHVEVGRKHAPLVSSRRHHEEVEGTTWGRLRVLDEASVHDAATGWVHELSSLVLDEEALGDALVDHD